MSEQLDKAALAYADTVRKAGPARQRLKDFDEKLQHHGGHTPPIYFGTVEMRLTLDVISLLRKQILADISGAEIDIENASKRLEEACGHSTTKNP